MVNLWNLNFYFWKNAIVMQFSWKYIETEVKVKLVTWREQRIWHVITIFHRLFANLTKTLSRFKNRFFHFYMMNHHSIILSLSVGQQNMRVSRRIVLPLLTKALYKFGYFEGIFQKAKLALLLFNRVVLFRFCMIADLYWKMHDILTDNFSFENSCPSYDLKIFLYLSSLIWRVFLCIRFLGELYRRRDP